MQVYGQLENATLEVLSADPSAACGGRVWWNSTTTRAMLDDGTNQRALFRNDQKFIFGNNGTAASNIRLNRAAAAILQLVVGSDTTAEGSQSTTLAQISAKQEGYAAASKPANGNPGRLIWVSDSKVLAVDDNSSWLSLVDVSTAQTLTNKTLTTPAVDMPLFTDQGSDPAAPAAGKTTLYTKSGHFYKIANGGSATQLAEVGVTNPQNVQLKSTTYTATNSDDTIICSGAAWSLTLYDCTTAAGNKGKTIKIIHQGSHLVKYTILTTSGQTLNGPNGAIASGSFILHTNGEALELVSDGVNWIISNHSCDTGWVAAGNFMDFFTFTVSSANATLAATYVPAWVFTCTAANATVAATYTNSAITFTVAATIAAGTTLVCTGPGSPAASGVLTKATGTGDASITYSAAVGNSSALATFTVCKTIAAQTSLICDSLTDGFNASGRLVKTAGTGDAVITYSAFTGAKNTTTASLGTRAIHYGAPTSNAWRWRRHGMNCIFEGWYYQTVAGPVAGTSDMLLSIPLAFQTAGQTFDSVAAPVYTGGSSDLTYTASRWDNISAFPCKGEASQDGANNLRLEYVTPYSSTQFRIWGQLAGGANGGTFGSQMFTGTMVCNVKFQIELPMTGWQP